MPPLAEITGAAIAAKVSFVPSVSAKALPQRMSEERSISAAKNPEAECVPRPTTSPVLGLHH